MAERNPVLTQRTPGLRSRHVAVEIDRYSAVLLSTEPAPVVHIAGQNPDLPSPPWLHETARRHAGRRYLFVVNNGLRHLLPTRYR